jgi:hypothetical protein
MQEIQTWAHGLVSFTIKYLCPCKDLVKYLQRKLGI